MTTADPTAGTFEHFLEPKSAGLGPLGKLGTTILFAIIVVSVFMLKMGWVIPAVLFGMATGLTLFISTVRDPVTKESTLEHHVAKFVYWRAEKTGANQYRSGPLTALGSYMLPGFLAQTKLWESTDSAARQYGMVEMPSTNHWAVTVETHPDGASLRDRGELRRQVDKHGEALKALCYEDSCEQAMITMVMAPETGHSMRARLNGAVTADAPDYAKQVVAELGEHASGGATVGRSFVTLTFNGQRAGKTRTAQQMADSLASRLPIITKQLSGTGAGRCTLMDGQSITETVRAAYDPACAADLAETHVQGRPLIMRWDSIGPCAADNHWEYYRHGDAVSVTWSMVDIHGSVNVDSLSAIVGPHVPDVDVTTVSAVYELRSPGEAPAVAQGDLNAADFRGTTERPSRRTLNRAKTALHTADRESHGDGLVDIAVLVTATVRDRVEEDGTVTPAVDRIPDMVAAIDSGGPQARLLLRRMDGCHAQMVAMNQACTGVIAADHQRVPVALREAL